LLYLSISVTQTILIFMDGVVLHRGVTGEGEVTRPPRAAETKGHKNEYFKLKKCICTEKNLKLWSQIKGNSINNCDFF
jgi:hypothetical protein